MTPVSLLLAAVVLALVFGFVAVAGSPIFAVPIVALALGGLAALYVRQRNARTREVRRFREQAEPQVDFTERDKLSQSRERPLR